MCEAGNPSNPVAAALACGNSSPAAASCPSQMARPKVVDHREELVEGQRVIVKILEPKRELITDEPIASRDDSRTPWQRDRQYEHR